MAKGNFWTRSVKGRLGDMVFYKSNGEQMTRSYNGNPANPRTDAQLNQRIKWTDTCLAYDFLKPVITETMVKRPQDQNNFNTFVSENVGKAPIVKKAVAEFAKQNGGAIIGDYTISKGSLSGFNSLNVASGTGFDAVGFAFPRTDVIASICSELAGAENEITIAFDVFLRKYLIATGEEVSHISVEICANNPELGANLIFNFDNYFEFWDNSIVNSLYFTKDGDGWVVASQDIPASIYTLQIRDNDGVISFVFVSPLLNEGAVYGYSVFKSKRFPQRDTQTAVLTLSETARNLLAELNDADAVTDAIASYRRSASAEDEQVFHG